MHAPYLLILTLTSSVLAGVMLPAPSVRACSPLPDVWLRPVASARVEGPFVFSVQCDLPSPACAADSVALTVELDAGVGSGGPALPGLTASLEDHPTVRRLITWTPSEPLQPGATYRASLGDGVAFFVPAASIVDDPFARLQVTETFEPRATGKTYRCEVDRSAWNSGSDCLPEPQDLWWSTEGVLESVLEANLGQADGFLFDSYLGEIDPTRSLRFDEAGSLSATLAPGGQACFVFEAWNLFTGERSSKRQCATATLKTQEERQVRFSAPDLEACKKPPVEVGSSEPAAELLEKWCRDRAEPCRGPYPNVSACLERDETCAQLESNGLEQDGGEDPTEASEPSPGASQRASACHAGSQQSLPLALALSFLALAFARRRLSSRARRYSTEGV